MVETKKSRLYKELEVWKLPITFATDIHQATEKVPVLENYGVTQQIREAAVSIPANIAAGQFKNSPPDHCQGNQLLSIIRTNGILVEYPGQDN
jgi:hypothetical protein